MSSPSRPKLSAEAWRRVSDLFHQAAPLRDKARNEFLERARQEHPSLFDDLRSLLATHDATSGLLENPVGPQLLMSLGHKRSAPFQLGDTVGDFAILRLLGSGSLAHVYLARQRSLDRLVALKVSEVMNDEARTMASVEHKHIVRIFLQERHAASGMWLIAMEYVPGPTLESLQRKLLDERQIPAGGRELFAALDSLCPREALFNPTALPNRERLRGFDPDELVAEIGADLADALSYAHTRGVLHLDLKPANILVDSYGRVFLSDFNVSLHQKPGEAQAPVGGTFKYMAPEQAKILISGLVDGGVDERADIYALGKVLLEWHGERNALRGTLDKCVAVSPDERPNAGELAATFRAWLAHRNLEKALPPAGWVIRRAVIAPVLTLSLVGAIPQILSTLIAISYNTTNILSALSESQRATFWASLNLYLGINYTWATAVWAWLMRRLQNDLMVADSGEARRNTLRLPFWSAVLTLLAWMPGSLFFPVVLQLRHGSIGLEIYLHFFLSFALSCAVALSYSHAFTQYLCLRALYPRFWSERLRAEGTAATELAAFRKTAFRYPFLSSAVPLIAAALILVVAPSPLLVLGLMSLSLTGTFVALPLVHRLGQTLRALGAHEFSQSAR